MIQFEYRQMHCNVRLTASTPDLSYAATKERKWGMTNRRKILKARSCSARSTPVIELESTFFWFENARTGRIQSKIRIQIQSKEDQTDQWVSDRFRARREGGTEGGGAFQRHPCLSTLKGVRWCCLPPTPHPHSAVSVYKGETPD